MNRGRQVSEPLIELQDLEKSYGDVKVVNKINLTIYKNEFLTLLGPSGCGKTTTLRMLAGFEKPDCHGVDSSTCTPWQQCGACPQKGTAGSEDQG